MDPYLETESGWGGVHQALIVAIQAELNRVLPEGFRARIDEYVWLQDEPERREQRVKPDAFLPEPIGNGHGVAVAAKVTTAPTVRGRLPAARRRRSRHVVVTGDGHRVLTVLEVFSPSNKQPGDDREAYLRKRREYLASVNLLEIDLLRSGERIPTGHPHPPPCDYMVISSRANEFPQLDVWAFTVRDPLPVLPVPIDNRHPHCPLDLRPCLDRVYDEGRFAVDIDYQSSPELPLRTPDAKWAATLFQKPSRKKK